MTGSSAPRAAVLLTHLERDLGEFTGANAAMKPETDLDFSLLQFDDRPESGVTATVTFGVSVHMLTGRDSRERREELVVLLQRPFDHEALDMAANIGRYLLDEHVALAEGETIRMPAQGGGRLDRLVAALPDPFPDRFARCDEFDPPIEFVWLLPFAQSEHHLVAEHGWRDLLDEVRAHGHSPYDLLRNVVL
jgi:Suppressor of fused protein (SUFU)